MENNDLIFTDGQKKQKVLSLKNLTVLADYQKEHFLAAVIGAKLLGVMNNTIYKGIKSYKGLHDRLEFLGEIKGIKYYNDTAATMPDAAISALKGLAKNYKKNIILLAGGADKKLYFKEFAANIVKYCKFLILFKGMASNRIYRLTKQKVNSIFVNNMFEAVKKAKEEAIKGDIILLSPGAASFGMFKHEFDRGDQFKKLINKYR